MPELPEVETMRRGIAGITGQTIVQVEYPPCQLRPMAVKPSRKAVETRLKSRRIESVERVGKRVVLKLDNGDSMVIEPRMTGLVLLADPPNREHLRMVLKLKGRGPKRMMFWDRRGLGVITLHNRDGFERALGPSKLGPDALEVDANTLSERLGKSRRAIKVALLDQSAVAGIGNLYAAEILFDSEIDPRAICCRLSKRQWERIASNTRSVLKTAIQYEGSTLSDGTYRNALYESGGYQNHHRVYDRAGERCFRCESGVVTRIVQAQRATFYCPSCQKKRDRRGGG